ncbi:MAG: alpha-amylase [Candidatus Hydrogenedens sp.]|nr:alpha-amylase [Candidatus Hydrogenedens sp.]
MAAHLFTEILRYISDQYSVEYNVGVFARGRAYVHRERGASAPGAVQRALFEMFPPQAVLDDPDAAEPWYVGLGEHLTHQDLITREAILVRLCNDNPAMKPYRELFSDDLLASVSPFREFISALEIFFEGEPPHPETGLSLVRTLRAPIEASPDDLEGQLDFVRSRWATWLPVELVERLLLTRGMLREERTMRGHGPGPAEALTFGPGAAGSAAGYPEYEAFSPDREWMPNVVLIAKTVYVWLDQLSKRHGRTIARLDQIPDAELDQLAGWGFTGLWLIGLWERSSVSRDMKRMMGNPEAEASAYSLYDYTIAYDLGGEEAYQNLAARAWRRGIRLASDMVPNHVGIYSRWVVEHPDWFIQSSYPPFPGYTYNGQDLSPDGRVSIHIEDGYWNHSDAAVTFKLHDHRDGRTHYVYHGNDGTSMPWNDTAQLNYLLPEVREAVIQTILYVAKRFPIIRFDAAMTLAKKHYQRLWFPKPGDAGAIPSRAEHGMSQEEFDRVFPAEFWREVVDRVAVEAPETLLLAEAFWLMEGYFVRTLGMHRVYNSAFMNMLKMEENAKYRQTLKNVLEYSPAILQRFVNFMNNPDEETAEFQFGKGDKYFGVCALLATLPGLPMFGHGQFEGLTEKYGMEYRRAYKDEPIDTGLVHRHEREICPLLRRRHLFSGAENFALFDWVAPEGHVDENVYAYSNRAGNERALIIFNNAYNGTRGVLHTSTAINEGPAEAPRLHRVPLAEALALDTAENCYYIFRDNAAGLEYIEHAASLAEYGLHRDLSGYGYAALIDWRAVYDIDHTWGRLHGDLAGRGVPSIEDAYMEMVLAPILEPFRALLRDEVLGPVAAAPHDSEARAALMVPYREFLERTAERCGTAPDFDRILEHALDDLDRLAAFCDSPWAAPYDAVNAFIDRVIIDPERGRRVLVLASLLRHIGAVAEPEHAEAISAAWMQEWFLTRQIARAFEAIEIAPWDAGMDALLVRLMIAHAPGMMKLQGRAWGPQLDRIVQDPDALRFLQVNRFNGRRWLREEQLARLLDMLLLAVCVREAAPVADARAGEIALALDDADTIRLAASDVGYDMDWLIETLK